MGLKYCDSVQPTAATMAVRMLCALLLVSAAAARQPVTQAGATAASEKLVGKTTPVSSVINLLKDLTKKVEAQGQAEAKAYDKYACFCKEQADNKQYAIETSDKKIKEFEAQIEELKAQINELNGEIADLSKAITDLEKKIKGLDTTREAEHDKYQENAAELVAAVDATDSAIETLKESKAAMEGKAQKEAALAQVRAHAKTASIHLTASQEEALNALVRTSRGPSDGKAYESSYHSNDVIETLEDLRKTFIGEKDSLDEAEFQKKKLYDEERLAASNEKQFKQEDKEEKEKLVAQLTAEKEQAVEDDYVEKRSKSADEDFMNVLTVECSEKAELWDKRSKTRADELQALGEATEALESGVAPNYGANRRLSDLQVRKAASFLQLRGSRQTGSDKALRLLQDASKRLNSNVLATLVVRMAAAEDHFVRVRQLIKDLIKRLEDQAKAEQTAKEACDKDVKAAVGERDSAVSEAEKHDKDKTIKEAEEKQLNVDIADLSQAIADNKKALMEATELRDEERADNTKVVSDAEAGLEAVKQAISILETFYTAAAQALLQTGADPKPNARMDGKREDELRFKSAKSDREGNTVADLAPDSFDSTYKGQQEASSGIIGTLQVIQSDFERTIQTTEAAESQAETDFGTFKDANEKDTGAKEGEKATKEKSLVTTEGAILSLTTDLKEATEEHELAEKKLESLKAGCVDQDESYEERTAKREQEIEALKEAHDILENWGSQ